MIPPRPIRSGIALVLLGCVGGGDEIRVPDADWATFVSEVQPVFEQSCSNPSCHGADDRPFEVFCPQRHRLDPDDTWRDTPLTEEELRLGFENARGFLVGIERPQDCPLVALPSSPDHASGRVFEDRTAPGWAAIFRWVADAGGEP